MKRKTTTQISSDLFWDKVEELAGEIEAGVSSLDLAVGLLQEMMDAQCGEGNPYTS